MLYHVMSCYIMLYYIILFNVMLCHVMSYYIILFNVMSCHVMSYYIILLLLYYIILYYVILYYYGYPTNIYSCVRLIFCEVSTKSLEIISDSSSHNISLL
jgi:hypothetical protein